MAHPTIREFTPIRQTVAVARDNVAFHREMYRLAEDCMNQEVIPYIHTIFELATEEER